MTKSDKKEQENKLSNNDESKIPDEEENNELKKPSMEEQLKTTQEKLLRTMAEMENQRRRFEKEIEEAFEFGGFNFAKESLALLDNIDRAIISFKNDEKLKNNNDLNKIIEGIEIVKKDLASNFKKNGIDEIECINKKFDPNYHQAMLELDSSDKEPGVVIQEMQKGYMMKGRLLRPSLVGVSKKKQENVEKK